MEEALLKYGEETSLSIMVLGKPGIGKSTLINGLVGERVAEVSAPGEIKTEGVTKLLVSYNLTGKNFTIHVWDTPGLQDASISTADVLAEIKERSNQIHLFLLCIDMSDTRYLPGEKTVQDMINEVKANLCKCIWKRTLVVLVRANSLIDQIKWETDDVENAFKRSLSRWSSLMTEELKDSLDSSTLNIVPAGHIKMKKLFVTDKNEWLSTFWEESFETILSPHGKVTLVKANLHRLTPEGTTGTDGKVEDIHQQKIIISSGFMERAKKTCIGAGIGGGAGAAGVAGATFLGLTCPILWPIVGAAAIGGVVGLVFSGSSASASTSTNPFTISSTATSTSTTVISATAGTCSLCSKS